MSEDLFCFEATPGSDLPCDAATSTCECKSPGVLGLADGLGVVYVGDAVRLNRALTLGDDFGVSTNVSP